VGHQYYFHNVSLLVKAAVRRTRKDEGGFTYTKKTDRSYEHAAQRGTCNYVQTIRVHQKLNVSV